MENVSSLARNGSGNPVILENHDADAAVSWSAIIGGTFATIAMSFILIGLGAGVGLASISPWAHEGMTAMHFTAVAAIWLIIVQWVSGALGGYLTGRLRTKWVGVHTHEVFFRDTAHGFLTWAVATVIGGLLILSVANMHSHSMKAAPPAATMSEERAMDPSSYYVDKLLRSDQSDKIIDPATKMEVKTLLIGGLKENGLSSEDKNYLTQVITTHTGVDAAEAEKRVDTVMNQMRQSADMARKAAATLSIYTFLSLLIGAFISSAAAALGGQQRDEPHPMTVA